MIDFYTYISFLLILPGGDFLQLNKFFSFDSERHLVRQ